VTFVVGALFALQLSLPGRVSGRSDVTALVARARAARYQQDSALASYQAIATQRISGGIGVAPGLGPAPISRVRLAARMESVARVGWNHELGAWAEVLAARAVVPFLGDVEPDAEDGDAALTLPYYPGRDRLWPMSELREAMPNDRDWIVHPLSDGADSVYSFTLGDSIIFRLPDASRVTLREIRIRARRPDERLIVGSIWVDVSSGALVRAAYRPSVPVDLWPFMERNFDEDDRKMVQRFGPFTGIVREVIIEHGLYQGRFWLPRTRIAHAEGTAKGGRVTASIEQTFRYERVAAINPNVAYTPYRDSVDVDPRTGRIRRPTWHGRGEESSRCRADRDTSDASMVADSLERDQSLRIMYSDGIRFRVLEPCDRTDLLTSPLLPPSIYDAGEKLFRESDFKALQKDVSQALAIDRQSEFKPQPVMFFYGLDRGMLRYNKVEGLSPGIQLERTLGNGYVVGGSARIGTADLEPNGEAFVERGNVRSTIRAAAYRRLVFANDWGNPFGVGASANALLFARDDGFYYRTLGGEITGTRQGSADGPVFRWRLFAERQDSASVETQESLARAFSKRTFPPNIAALTGTYAGANLSAGAAWGSNPLGTRASASARLEGVGGETNYGRGSAELTLLRGFGRTQATLTGSAGSTLGDVPTQRLWFLGGAQTIRGHAPGTLAGNSYWMGRAEVARGSMLVRPSVFADIGWAGDRTQWSNAAQPIAGAGFGMTAMDGLVRLDIARRLNTVATDRGRAWRAELYLEVR